MPMLDRRRLLLSSSAGLAAAAIPGLLVPRRAAAADFTVGFIYVGPKDDYGYNQAHAEGAATLKSMPGITVIEEENVPETVDVQKTMESMINLDGASLIFPTSFGYFDPHMLKMCEKYPDVQFRHCGGMWNKDKHPMNAGSYFGYIGQAQYLNGIVAGHTSKTKKIGFVAAKPIPQVLININSFALGARSVDPSITTQVIFTGDWSLPVKEAEATNSLVDQGVDVVTCHVDGPKVVIETAERRGIYTCGYHADQSALAPKGYLTGAEWNWATVYAMFVESCRRASRCPTSSAAAWPRTSSRQPLWAGRRRRRARPGRRHQGRDDGRRLRRVQGPAQGQQGNVVIPAGQAFVETAPELESMGYLVEGVLGATS